MRRKSLALYVSTVSTVAAVRASTLPPVMTTHAELSDVDWAAVAASLHADFGRVSVQLLLSARQCHYQVLPWLSSCYTGAAVRDYVAHAFAAVGVSDQSCVIEVDWPRYGEPVVAAAYPRAVIESLRAGLVMSGHVLAGVDSSVGPILRRYADALDTPQALLAYAEDDGITAITLEQGSTVQIETLSNAGTGLDDLGAWCSRKRFAFANDSQLRWLETTEKPPVYPGPSLRPIGSASASAGHAVVIAWQ